MPKKLNVSLLAFSAEQDQFGSLVLTVVRSFTCCFGADSLLSHL